MSDQHTKVTYTAVSKFSSLQGDLNKLLTTLEAIKKAEKDIGKGGNRRGPNADKNSSSGNSAASNAKSLEANEKRRIARYNQAQKILEQRENRHQKSLDQALARRNRNATQAQKILAAQETRQERVKDDAQRRRSAKAKQDQKSAASMETRSERSKDAAQRRRDRKTDEAEREREREAKHHSDARRRAERASLEDAIKMEAHAARQAEIEETSHLRRMEQAKNEGQRERIRQERFAARDAEAKSKRSAEEVARKLVAARTALDVANRDASDANRFTNRKVATRSVGQVKVDFDPDKDVNYFEAVSRAREEELRLVERSTQAVNREMESRGALYNILRKIAPAAREAGTSLNSSFRSTNRDIRQTNGLLTNFSRNLDQVGRWRPRLIPPFIALVPIIGSLLGLINPLVAGLGAIGGAAIGLAGSLGSLAGAALGAIPALASLLSLGAALKMTFGGVGKALKAAGKANGTSGTGTSGSAAPTKEELTQVEKIARAQEAYKRSIEDVADATKGLDDAKKAYLDRLKEIEKQIEKVRLSEARLQANAQLAKENYWNVMADSGSTKGQKMDAFAGMTDANQDLVDMKQEVKDLKKELADMKSGGMGADKGVRDATRRLTDAIYAQRDAQLDLANAYKDTGDAAGSNGGAATAIDEFEDAMAKLSPSAQAVVLALLAMQPAWEAVKRSVQESFFSEIVDDINLLVKLFPTLDNLLGKTAGAFGRVASKALKLVTSDKWLRDLNLLADANVPLVENMGDGLLSILDTFRDLTIALLPFTTAMSEGFKEGADNFAKMVENARETGSLAAWMEVVRGRLAQWWRIIKNIGVTLFNYTAAAAPFGQWLTDGLENMSKSWREASEEARKEGSPFQTFLENSKPALTALQEMFGTFFSWFAREAANVDNIDSFTRIIEAITTELGPALARIFDVMSEAGVGESLLDAVIQIVETLADFLEKGGAEGIKTFFETINKLFSAFADVIDRLPPEAIQGIAGALMTISALRFFGITKLIGMLTKLAGATGLAKLTGLFKSMKGVNNVPTPKPTATGQLPIGAGGTAPTTPVGKVPTPVVAAPTPKGGFLGRAGKVLGRAGKFAKGAGPIGLAVSAGVGMVRDTLPTLGSLSDGSFAKDPRKGAIDFQNVVAKWASPGTGLGIDLISWLFPEAGKNIEDFISTINTAIYDWFQDTPQNIADVAVDLWNSLPAFGDWLAEKWVEVGEWLAGLPERIFEFAGEVWGNIQNFNDWLAEKWVEAGEWLAGLPALILESVGTLWGKLQNFNEWLAEKWVEAGEWLAGLPRRILDSAKDIWRNLLTFNDWLEDKWEGAKEWLSELPQKIGDAVVDLWEKLPTLASWLAEQGVAVVDWAKGLPQAIGDAFSGLGEAFERGEKNTRNPKGGLGDTTGLAKGGAGGSYGMSRGAGKKDKGTATDDSMWSQVFGDPITWLNEKWAEIPGWLAGKVTEMVAPIQTAATTITLVWTTFWTGLTTTLRTAYDESIKPIIDKIGGAFNWLKDDVIVPVWDGIKTTIWNVWYLGVLPVLATMNAWVKTKPKEAFEAARDGISEAWNGIKELAKVPVRFVVDVVLGGLVSAINSIPNVNVKPPKLPAGFHDGGYTGNAPARQVAGVVHGDEHVIRSQARQKIERSNPGLLDHMNTFGEVPGYKKGGLVNPLPAGSYNVSQPYSGSHNGIDLAAPSGTKVYATGEGTVQLAGVVPMGGNEVYIQHDNGLGTRYSHLSSFASRPGDKVKPGNIIGYVGSTGMSTGPHLHYMVHNPGGGPGNYSNHTDPAGWMNGNAQELGESWNPLTGLADFVTSKIGEKFPGGGMWVKAAANLAKSAVPQIISGFSPKIGEDKKGHTLFDKGGWWNGEQKPVSKLNQPEAILTTPQWESMHNISSLMTSAFAGVGSAGSTASFRGAAPFAPSNSVSTSAPVDKSIRIEKVEVNNPVGETTDKSIANVVRDLTFLGS